MNRNDVEAAKYLGLNSAQTLRNWEISWAEARLTVGWVERIVYRQEDLDRFLESGRIDPEVPARG